MRLNSATMFLASLMIDDDEFRVIMDEWKKEIDGDEERSGTTLTDGEAPDGRR